MTNDPARLRAIALFEELDQQALARVAERCSFRTYPRNAPVMTEQDTTNDVFFVLSGTVRINSHSTSGREVAYSDAGVGAVLGEFSAIDSRPRSTNVIALTECHLARMSGRDFSTLVRTNPTVAFHLVEALVAKIRAMSERVFELSALAVSERVRRELARMAGTGGKVMDAPTHQEFAARIGTHREAVTRELGRLAAEGIIEVKQHQIRILDPGRLRRADDVD